MRQTPDTLIDAMVQLETALVAEDVALRAFDLAEIAATAQKKAELEEVLASALVDEGPDAWPLAWTDDQRGKLLALRERVGTLARANLRRLKASLGVVRSLVDHVTGAQPQGYGKQRGATNVQPVLASDIG